MKCKLLRVLLEHRVFTLTVTVAGLAIILALTPKEAITEIFVRTKSAHSEADSARVILQRYADAWRGREEMSIDKPVLVAFWIKGEGGGKYKIILSEKPRGDLSEGTPEQYDLGFEMDIDLLRRLDRNEINALTAMGQTRSADAIPLVPKFGSLLSSRTDGVIFFRRFCFHFWNRDYPEIVRFGDGMTREVHGGNATVLYYDEKFRSAWYQLKPGMHVNSDPNTQIAPFNQLLVITRGTIKAKFDGKERSLKEGQAVFIPVGMRTESWTEANQYGEAVWIALGDGA